MKRVSYFLREPEAVKGRIVDEFVKATDFCELLGISMEDAKRILGEPTREYFALNMVASLLKGLPEWSKEDANMLFETLFVFRRVSTIAKRGLNNAIELLLYPVREEARRVRHLLQ